MSGATTQNERPEGKKHPAKRDVGLRSPDQLQESEGDSEVGDADREIRVEVQPDQSAIPKVAIRMGHEVAGVKEALQQFEHAPCKLVAERPAKSLPLFRFYPSAKTLYSVQKRQERPDPYRADLRRLMAFPTTKTSSPISGRLRRADSGSDAGKASRRGPIDGIITADYSV